jgi:hypothetical protein
MLYDNMRRDIKLKFIETLCSLSVEQLSRLHEWLDSDPDAIHELISLVGNELQIRGVNL